MSNSLKVIDHPLIRHKIGFLRDVTTNSAQFRAITAQLSSSLVYECLRDWDKFDRVDIETPIAKTCVDRMSEAPIVVSILRAGNGMLDAVLEMVPFAHVGFVGIYRDKFINNTVEYYFKLPENCEGKEVIVCDPLIATSDTMVAALDRLKNYEVGKIRVISLLAHDEGVKKILHYHPDVDIYTCGIETEITEQGYLVPGLGDAGDRLYKTK